MEKSYKKNCTKWSISLQPSTVNKTATWSNFSDCPATRWISTYTYYQPLIPLPEICQLALIMCLPIYNLKPSPWFCNSQKHIIIPIKWKCITRNYINTVDMGWRYQNINFCFNEVRENDKGNLKGLCVQTTKFQSEVNILVPVKAEKGPQISRL